MPLIFPRISWPGFFAGVTRRAPCKRRWGWRCSPRLARAHDVAAPDPTVAQAVRVPSNAYHVRTECVTRMGLSRQPRRSDVCNNRNIRRRSV